MRRKCCTAAPLTPLSKGGLREGHYVMAWRVVGGEVGGYEKVARIVWQSIWSRYVKINNCIWGATDRKAYISWV